MFYEFSNIPLLLHIVTNNLKKGIYFISQCQHVLFLLPIRNAHMKQYKFRRDLSKKQHLMRHYYLYTNIDHCLFIFIYVNCSIGEQIDLPIIEHSLTGPFTLD